MLTPQSPTDIIHRYHKKLFTVLPYIPKLSAKVKRTLKRLSLNFTFNNSNTIQSFFNSDKDKTIPSLGSGVYKIPCSWGCSYVGATQQQLGKRLSEQKSSIGKATGLRLRPETFGYIDSF